MTKGGHAAIDLDNLLLNENRVGLPRLTPYTLIFHCRKGLLRTSLLPVMVM